MTSTVAEEPAREGAEEGGEGAPLDAADVAVAESGAAEESEEAEQQQREPWIALTALVVLAGISAAAYYLGFVRPYLLQQYYDKPLLDLAKINKHTLDAANGWAFTWIILFACYYAAFRFCPGLTSTSRSFRTVALALVGGWTALFCLNLLFMYPVGAADIFDHMFRGRMVAEYGLNPFTVVPAQVASDPLFRYIAWPREPSHYGPLWEVLAAATSIVAGADLFGNIIFFKLLVLAAHAVSIALTYAILRELKPDWALRGVIFYAWNPLILFEIAGNGHHESFVAMFVLAAVLLLVKGRLWAVLPALAAGALTKFVPLLLVLPAAAAIWRDRAPRRGRWGEEGPRLFNQDALAALATGGGVSLLMAAVLYFPFWEGTRSIGALYMGNLFTASIPRVALDWLTSDLDWYAADAQLLVRYAALALAGLAVVGMSLYVFLKRNAVTGEEHRALVRRTLVACYEIMFVYLAFSTLWFQPWYLVWLAALTAPLASITYAHRTILFCIGGVANYFVWDFFLLWHNTGGRSNQITSAMAVYSLPLLYTLYVILKQAAGSKWGGATENIQAQVT